MTNYEKNNKQIKDEWVIRLIDAAKDVVVGYEKYLMDELDYTDLAHLMVVLREILPTGCIDKKEDDEKENKK